MSSIIFSQGSTSINVNFEFSKKSNTKVLTGTACKELFKLIDLQSNGTIKLFKLSQPIDIAINSGKVVLDTCNIDILLKSKLKVNKTYESKARFVGKVRDLFAYVTSEKVEITADELIKTLQK